MGSDNSKLQLAVDHFYYTDEKLEGKLLIDGKLMQKIKNITISFIGKLSIVFEGSYENVKFCTLQKTIMIEQSDKPIELHFTIDLHNNLPPSAFIERKNMSGEIDYLIEASADQGSMFGPAHIQKQIIVRQSISEKGIPAEFDKKLPSGFFLTNDSLFSLLKIKINKTEFTLGEIAEIILDIDNRQGLYNIIFFNINLIQTVNVEEEMEWLREKQNLSSQAISGINKFEQSISPHIINLPIIDSKGIFIQKIKTGFMIVEHHIEISAFNEEQKLINSITFPIVITQKEPKCCSYNKVNSINGIKSNIDLGKVDFEESQLQENFHKLKIIKLAYKIIHEILFKKRRR